MTDRIEQAKRDLDIVRYLSERNAENARIIGVDREYCLAQPLYRGSQEAADRILALITDLVAENERLNSNIDTFTKYAAEYAQQVIDLKDENERNQELLEYYEREYAISEVIAERDDAQEQVAILQGEVDVLTLRVMHLESERDAVIEELDSRPSDNFVNAIKAERDELREGQQKDLHTIVVYNETISEVIAERDEARAEASRWKMKCLSLHGQVTQGECEWEQIARVLADQCAYLEYSGWMDGDQTTKCKDFDGWLTWAREQVNP